MKSNQNLWSNNGTKNPRQTCFS